MGRVAKVEDIKQLSPMKKLKNVSVTHTSTFE